MSNPAQPRRGQRRATVVAPRHVGYAVGLTLCGIFFGGVLTLVIYQLVLRITEALLPPGRTVVMWRIPGPFAGWLNLWAWLSVACVVLMLPAQWVADRQIRRRSRELKAFVLWRIQGVYELHRPQGRVVPVYELGVLTSVRPDEVERAQWFAELEIHALTGHGVVAWEQDKADRRGVSSWVARLSQNSGPGESPREKRSQQLAELRTIKIWSNLGIKELEKLARGESFEADYPPCPVCRGWVAHFDSISDDTRIGLTFTPCGCSYLVDRTTRRVRTIGGSQP